MAILRKRSGLMPRCRVSALSARVKKVKLTTRPVTIPSGRRFPPVIPADNTTGRIGRMQGARMVAIPARKAKKMSINTLES